MPYYTLANFKPCESFGYLTKRLHKAAQAAIEQRFVDLDLSFTQWVSLTLVGEGMIETAAALASHLGHDSGATTRLIDGLEKRGFMERRRDPTDRRVVRLSLTPEGRTICQALTPRVIGFWNEALAEFEIGDVERMLGMLRRLNERISEMEEAK